MLTAIQVFLLEERGTEEKGVLRRVHVSSSWKTSHLRSHHFRSSSQMSKFLPSPFLGHRVVPISISVAFGPRSCASTVYVTVRGWSSSSTVCFTPMLFPKMLNAKQRNSMCNFLSLWYDSSGYRTLTYRVQREHSTIGPWMRWSYSISSASYSLPYQTQAMEYRESLK